MTLPETVFQVAEDLMQQGCSVHTAEYLEGDGRYAIGFDGEAEIGRYGTWSDVEAVYLVGDVGALYIKLSEE